MTSRMQFAFRPLLFILVLIGVWVIGGALLPNFSTPYNLANIGVQAALVALAAFGMTVVLLTGGIDLSIGGLMSLTGVLFATFTGAGAPLFLAILLSFVGGAIVGLINGLCVAYLGLPPFITTFGTLGITAGLALFISNVFGSRSIPIAMVRIGNGKLGAFPILVIIAVVVLVLLELLTRRTAWGVHLRAVGDAPSVAQVRGVAVKRTLVSAYLASGILTAGAGIFLASHLSTASPIQGEPYTLTAVAACVIGGVDLFGGRGQLWAAALGTVFLAALRNALNLIGVEPFMQGLVTGVLIIAAVLLTIWWPRFRAGFADLLVARRVEAVAS